MTLRHVPIDKASLPYRFELRLGGRTFALEIHYNAEEDLFTADLYNRDGSLIAAGERLVYGQPLWAGRATPDYPAEMLVPYDLSGRADDVTDATFQVSVFLWLIGPEDYADA